MKQTLLSLSNLTKQFDGKKVLDSLDLDIFDGEFITLLGPSGCGKTTLLRMMAGFEHPDDGTIALGDQDLTHTPPEHRPLNTVFQNYALFPHMSVFDNVAYGLKMEKRPKQEIRERVEDALAMVQLEDFARRKPHQLSGGQQQRVAIGRTLAARPALVLADEPTGNLDEATGDAVMELLLELVSETGAGLLMVTHSKRLAGRLDRQVHLHAGLIA